MKTFPARRRSPARVLARLALFPLGLIAYLAIVFEESLWRWGCRFLARLGRLPLFAQIENRLRAAPPWAAACAFLIPGAVLFPFKLAALSLIAHGHPLLGALAFVGAKFAGAAALARVWALCESSLRQIPWLGRTLDWIFDKKDRLKAWASGLWAIRLARGFVLRLAARARSAKAKIAARLWIKAKTWARAR